MPPGVSLEHVPFGLVQGEDGKKFKTRSGETVKLVDLLQARPYSRVSQSHNLAISLSHYLTTIAQSHKRTTHALTILQHTLSQSPPPPIAPTHARTALVDSLQARPQTTPRLPPNCLD